MRHHIYEEFLIVNYLMIYLLEKIPKILKLSLVSFSVVTMGFLSWDTTTINETDTKV